MGGASLNYEAMKDFIRWSSPKGYDVDELHKTYIPILTGIANHVVAISKTQKS